FMTGDSAGAIEALEESYNNVDESEKGDVAYMLGHLYYADGQNEKAFQYFDTVKDEEKFSRLVKPYYVQLYYNEKEYNKAISEGEELLNENVSDTYKAEIHKIIGESYFMKGDYEEAYPHLKEYLQAQSTPSESDLYEMGYITA
ncbi:tetratricopeptide repeat protein, partial [Escherichia coli]|nr:tetratricopeptide repeat protein [Escherichia coli]